MLLDLSPKSVLRRRLNDDAPFSFSGDHVVNILPDDQSEPFN
jgi:hypothetical protein